MGQKEKAPQYVDRKVTVAWWVYEALADRTSDILAITGGLGSSKTTGSAIYFISRWLENQNSQFSWAVAPTHTKIEQILLPAVRFVLSEIWNLKDGIDYRIYKGRFFKLVLPGYDHEIHFLSGDRPGLFVGSNVSTIWITEPGLMDREVYEKSQTRLRCPRAAIRQIILEGTPEGTSGKGGWWADLADIQGAGYDRRDLERNIRRFIVETTHNRHLKPSPEEYAQKKIRDVFAYDKNKILSYEKGLFVPFEQGLGFWEWVESRNVIPQDDVAPSPHLTINLTFDFNVSPLAWVVCQTFQFQKNYFSERTQKYIAVEEASGESRGLMDAIAEFASKFPLHQYADTPIEVYGDASGHARNIHSAGSDYTAIEQYLRALGYRKITIVAARSNPLIKHRLEKIAALMAYERFGVRSNCRKLMNSFRKTTLKPGTFEIEKPQGEDHTHFADACTYYLYQVSKDSDIANPNARRIIGV